MQLAFVFTIIFRFFNWQLHQADSAIIPNCGNPGSLAEIFNETSTSNMELIAGLSLAAIIVFAIFRFIEHSNNKQSYYRDSIAKLNQKSNFFASQNISSEIPTAQAKDIVEKALKNPTILNQIDDHNENKRVSDLFQKERNWYIYNNVDEILLLFNGKKTLHKEELFERMRGTYANDSAIEKKLQEYAHYICVTKGRDNNYKMNLWIIIHPNSKEYRDILIENYIIEEKRKAFRQS